MGIVTKPKLMTVGMVAPEFHLAQAAGAPTNGASSARANGRPSQSEANGEFPQNGGGPSQNGEHVWPASLETDLMTQHDEHTNGNGSSPIVSLAQQRTRGHVAIYFMRAFHCLPCRAHARRLAAARARFYSYGVVPLIIGPGSPSDAESLASRLQIPYPVLADETGRVAAAYGFRKVLFNTVLQSGTVLIDKDGVIRYARRTANPSSGYDAESLFLALRNL